MTRQDNNTFKIDSFCTFRLSLFVHNLHTLMLKHITVLILLYAKLHAFVRYPPCTLPLSNKPVPDQYFPKFISGVNQASARNPVWAGV